MECFFISTKVQILNHLTPAPPRLNLSSPINKYNLHVNVVDSPPALYPNAKRDNRHPKIIYNNKIDDINENLQKENKMKKLEEFLSEMKKYVNENDMQDDTFMANLCDDIYICIKGLCSTKGYMYVATRSISQGCERAYNVRNLDNLRVRSDSILYKGNNFRSLQNHNISTSNFTTYASEGATNIMRQVSGN